MLVLESDGGDGSSYGNHDDNVDGFSTAIVEQTLNKLLCIHKRHVHETPSYINTTFNASQRIEGMYPEKKTTTTAFDEQNVAANKLST